MKEHIDPWAWYDHRKPNVQRAIDQRISMLRSFRSMPPADQGALMSFYADHPINFINDWGVTVDPRAAAKGGITQFPFILFDRQEEFVQWVYKLIAMEESGVCDKSRDVGMSWLCVAIAAHLAIFKNHINVGFGSRKEEYVDKGASPKSLFWKLRQFILMLPQEMRGGFSERRDSAHMRVSIPHTGSTITGEAGDNIGRGDRSLVHFIDESAFLERPMLIEASLSATTNTRIDVSSVNGTDNPFYEKRHTWPDYKTFTFRWQQDPRKDMAWYEKQKIELSPIVVAQEIDLDYETSKENILIQAEWINAVFDAHEKLAEGRKMFEGDIFGAYDIATVGLDKNSLAMAKGCVVFLVEDWSERAIEKSCNRIMAHCDTYGCFDVTFDSDGVGSSFHGTSELANERRVMNGQQRIHWEPFHNGGTVIDPDRPAFKTKGKAPSSQRLNRDYYAHRKAQGYWHLARLFENTFNAVNGDAYDRDMLISIATRNMSPDTQSRLRGELNRPQYMHTSKGKIDIEKAPEGTKSPNMADTLMMLMAPRKKRRAFFS